MNIPPDAPAKCFPGRIRAMFGQLERPGGFTEVLVAIIVKQSSFVFFLVFTYLFSYGSASVEKAKGWSDEVA